MGEKAANYQKSHKDELVARYPIGGCVTAGYVQPWEVLELGHMKIWRGSIVTLMVTKQMVIT